MLDTIEQIHDHTHAQNRFAVIPTTEKLGLDNSRSGRGVTIAFLDSGFYPHPDFVSRVIAFHDVAGEDVSLDRILKPEGHHWHGTQTVTSCAGDGRLSDGIYRGIAYEAQLVLVKVSRKGRIADHDICDGLRWVIANRDRYKIRILNLSLGGDCDVPTTDSEINSLIEDLTSAGVVVTVAAGNSSESHSGPPASAPSAITVGGYSDENRVSPEAFELYHSNHGSTADGLVKPELIAPAMYVAAPILPGTSDYEAAELLSMIAAAPDYAFEALLREHWKDARLEHPGVGRETIQSEIRRRKIVATHYQHVDGTSFAAPIVASVVALMLETNPQLTPAVVRNILCSTASRLSGHPAVRQGFGVINAPAAVAMAKDEMHDLSEMQHHSPRMVGREIVFRFHHDTATTVHLACDFNGWAAMRFGKCTDGIWKIAIPCRPPGRYLYKFLIDASTWTEDPSHGFKEEDGFDGFNSVLEIA